MVVTDEPRAAFLLHQGHLYRWSAAGYAEKTTTHPEQTVTVLTPASVTRVLAAGYRPMVHPSIDTLVASQQGN